MGKTLRFFFDDAWVPVPASQVTWPTGRGSYRGLKEGYQSFVVQMEKKMVKYDIPNGDCRVLDSIGNVVSHNVESTSTGFKVSFFVSSSGKFRIEYQGKVKVVVVNLDYLMVCGLAKHSDVSHALGGGNLYYNRISGVIQVFGTSGTYGPYDKEVVQSCLVNFRGYIKVGDSLKNLRKELDPDYSLLRSHPHSRYIGKYFGEICPLKHRIVNQIHYKGVEKRILINVPEMKLFGRKDFGHGHQCNACRRVMDLGANIVKMNNVDPHSAVISMYTSILGHSHDSRPGQVFSKALAHVQEYAMRHYSYNQSVVEIAKSLGVKEKMIERAVKFLQHQGLIEVRHAYDTLGARDFPVRSVIDFRGERLDVMMNTSETEYLYEYRRYTRDHVHLPMSDSIQYLHYHPERGRYQAFVKRVKEPLSVSRLTKYVSSMNLSFCKIRVNVNGYEMLKRELYSELSDLTLCVSRYEAGEDYVIVIGGETKVMGTMSATHDHIGSIGSAHLWKSKEIYG